MAAIKWKSGVNGDWATATDWSTGTAPGAADDVTIDATGNFTVTINSAEAAHSLVLNSAAATVADNNALTIGATLSIVAGTFQVNSAGDVSGGTLSASGGSFLWNGGTLDGVVYDGTLNLSTNSADLTITANGITLHGAGGTGAGTVDVTGFNSHLYFYGSQTLRG